MEKRGYLNGLSELGLLAVLWWLRDNFGRSNGSENSNDNVSPGSEEFWKQGGETLLAGAQRQSRAWYLAGQLTV